MFSCAYVYVMSPLGRIHREWILPEGALHSMYRDLPLTNLLIARLIKIIISGDLRGTYVLYSGKIL